MSSKPLGSFKFKIGFDGKEAQDGLAEWNKEIRESLGLSEDFSSTMDYMAQDMIEYAQNVGVSKDKLGELKENFKKNKEIKEFAFATGISADELKRVGEEAELARNSILEPESIDNMTESMKEYAESIGLTDEKLKQLKETAKKNKEIEEFSRRTGISQEEVRKLGQEAQATKGKLGFLKGAMAGVAALGIGAFLKRTTGQLFELGKQAEQTRMSLEFITGSQKLAKEASDMLNSFSNRGVFSSTETNAVGKRLLNLKMPIEEVQKTLGELGNIAAGSSMSLESLANIYAKNKTLNLVQMSDLKQLSAQGIPIFEELGEVLGISGVNSEDLAQKIKEMSQSGRIQFGHLQQALTNMSTEGGLYSDVMDRMSNSAAGLSAAFRSKSASIKQSLGEVIAIGFRPILAIGVRFLDWLEKSPVAMGILRTSLIVIIPLLGTVMVVALYAAAKATWKLIVAQGILSAATIKAMLPFILIGIAILALILIIEDLYHWFTGGESVIGQFVQGFLDRLKGLGTAVRGFFTGIINTVKGFFVRIKNVVKGFFVSAIDLFKKYGKFLIMYLFPISILFFYWDQISSFLGGVPDKIVGFFKSIPARIKAVFSNLKTFLKGLLPDWVVNLVTKNTGGKAGKKGAVEARASGGPVSAGKPYLVGEEGPELFTPGRSGTIVPNKALSSGGSGGGKNINITIAPVFNISGASDPETIVSLVMKKIEDIIPLVGAELGLEIG
jgi:hypothetical protein